MYAAPIPTKKTILPVGTRFEDEIPSDGEVVPLQGEDAGSFEERFDNLEAVIAGATGKTGQAIAKKLLTSSGAKVKGLVRDTATAAQVYGSYPRLQLAKADVFQYATLQGQLEGYTTLFIATGSRPGFDPFGPFNVDYQGTVNLVNAAKRQGIKKIVLVSSVGVEESFFPLNLFWGILFWKKRAEEAVQRSGIDYTIVRPGGLTDDVRGGNIVLARSGAFGLPPRRLPGSISRSQVADICIQAALDDAASNKVAEAVAEDARGASSRLLSTQFFEL